MKWHPRLTERDIHFLETYPQLIRPEDIIHPPKRENTKKQQNFARNAVFGDRKETTAIGRKAEYERLRDVQKETLTRLRPATWSAILARQNERSPAQLAEALGRRRQEGVAKPSGADRRRFNPDPFGYPQTIYGTRAGVQASARSLARRALRFITPSISIPCISRLVRRQVIFAKKKNRGHHTRKRRSLFSHIGC